MQNSSTGHHKLLDEKETFAAARARMVFPKRRLSTPERPKRVRTPYPPPPPTPRRALFQSRLHGGCLQARERLCVL